MKLSRGQAVQYALGLGLGAVLLYLALRNLKLDELKAGFDTLHWEWVAAATLAVLAGHMVRAWRWQQLLHAAGHPVSLPRAWAALMVGYMTNNAVPRLGEVTRCTMLYRSNGVPISTSVGTVLTERATDVLALLLLLLSMAVLESERMLVLLAPNSAQAARTGLPVPVYAALLGLGLSLVLWFSRRYWMHFPLAARVLKFATQLLQAAGSIRKLQMPWLFVFQSVLLWVVYTFTVYFNFKALEATQGLSLYFAYVLTAGITVAMALPVPGGLGTFHQLVERTFVLFGLASATGALFAVFTHTPQYLLNLIGGGIGYVYLLLARRVVVPAASTAPDSDSAVAPE